MAEVPSGSSLVAFHPVGPGQNQASRELRPPDHSDESSSLVDNREAIRIESLHACQRISLGRRCFYCVGCVYEPRKCGELGSRCFVPAIEQLLQLPVTLVTGHT